jgi:arginine-tRNA-protein transferase
MDYKTRFLPQEHLTPRGWERFDPAELTSDSHR